MATGVGWLWNIVILINPKIDAKRAKLSEMVNNVNKSRHIGTTNNSVW